MSFEELARKRFSCRKFKDKKVDDKLIDKIIEVANLAPTAVNKQPFTIFRVESKETKDAIKECTRFTFGADTFLIVGYKNEEGWVRKFDSRAFADVDASIVATHIMMEIEDLGLATTWVGYFDAPKLKELCPVLKDYELIAIFPIGYPDEEPSQRHFERKEIKDIEKRI